MKKIPIFHHRFILDCDGARIHVEAKEGHPLKFTGDPAVVSNDQFEAWCSEISLFLSQEGRGSKT